LIRIHRNRREPERVIGDRIPPLIAELDDERLREAGVNGVRCVGSGDYANADKLPRPDWVVVATGANGAASQHDDRATETQHATSGFGR
jgi:hypothetical protein